MLAWVVSKNGAPTAIDNDGEIKFSLSTAERVFIFSEGNMTLIFTLQSFLQNEESFFSFHIL